MSNKYEQWYPRIYVDKEKFGDQVCECPSEIFYFLGVEFNLYRYCEIKHIHLKCPICKKVFHLKEQIGGIN